MQGRGTSWTSVAVFPVPFNGSFWGSDIYVFGFILRASLSHSPSSMLADIFILPKVDHLLLSLEPTTLVLATLISHLIILVAS